ncbi:Transcription factor [Cordyceps fumosorosea ARSEF 2679]|uniref:Transcription factor n=1 Tax=Cordyceps fumosorosea (strain ARSEF 2679) TaxID=1081104 RepID=A0A162K4T4_CORFA|nr:Transcription factor [Cordyceps fumosorosea ARSEF 2679]OAA53348.1 Transcription factor [Cordyceps fumosorosea ARSEF 2679]
MPPNTHPVCDSCRLRKTRCDRALPCSTCLACDLPCRYRHSLQRRGPKGGKGRRLAIIKRAQAEEDATGQAACYIQRAVPVISDGVSPHRLQVPDAGSLSPSPFQEQGGSSGACSVLVAHVRMFMANLFPVMPVVDATSLEEDCAVAHLLPPPRYTLLLALAAVTRIQLRLDHPEEHGAQGGTRLHEDGSVDDCTTGPRFLEAAETARQKVNVADTMSEDAILTSFFLFVCYGNQENHKKAWFYLNQSVSMALLLDLDNETAESVAGLTDKDIDRRRRIFWLLFISERTYALQRRMPVLLRRTVPKPQIFDSDYPIIMNDFVNHINVFESLPLELYEWQPEPSDSSNLSYIGQRVIQALCTVQPQNSVLESQQLDTLITQNWLRVVMWRLMCGIAGKSCHGSVALPDLRLPFDAGSSILLSLTSSSTASKNRHGISLEQKLFDIGTSLVDVSPSATASAMILGPQDLFAAIVNTLRCIRGRESHLLPKLLQHSQEKLGAARLGWSMDVQVSTPPFSTALHSARFEELPSPGAFDGVDFHHVDSLQDIWDESHDALSLNMIACDEGQGHAQVYARDPGSQLSGYN